jgi:hypothetical protein
MKALATSESWCSQMPIYRCAVFSCCPNQWQMSLAALGLYQEHRMTKRWSCTYALKDPRVAVTCCQRKSVPWWKFAYRGSLNGQDTGFDWRY